MEIQKKINKEIETLALSKQLANLITDAAIIFLYGPLGAGKTTFVRGFLQALGYAGKVKSPTYTIVEPYEVNGKHIFHFDFYRLTNNKELEDIGIEEYFAQPSICLIEWPEKGFPLLPTPDLACYIDFNGQERTIRLIAHTLIGKNILQKL